MQHFTQKERPLKKRRYHEAFETLETNDSPYLMMSESDLLDKLSNLEKLFMIMMNNIQTLSTELIKIESQIDNINNNDIEHNENIEECNIDNYTNSYFS
jgi:hypothetical protein